MDPGPGIATTGRSFISLNENEQICYSGLHSLCQADGSGKLSASKVGELLRASQLPAETLHHVSSMSSVFAYSVVLRTCRVRTAVGVGRGTASVCPAVPGDLQQERYARLIMSLDSGIDV